MLVVPGMMEGGASLEAVRRQGRVALASTKSGDSALASIFFHEMNLFSKVPPRRSRGRAIGAAAATA